MPTAILRFPTYILGRLVLLVEDESVVALEMRQTLTAAGVRVLGPAASVNSALGLIHGERPDAAILDLKLHGELVTPVARRLREMGVPFALSSAYDCLRIDEEAFSGVVNLGKPMVLTRCVEVLGRLLA